MSSSSASISLRDGSPYSVMEYISRYSNYLDACLFAVMRIVADQPLIYDHRFNKYRDTAVGAWIKRWRNCDGRGASLSQCPHASTDSPFVWCYEEVDYERRLSAIVAAHHTSERKIISGKPTSACRFFPPYDHVYFISN